MEYRRRDAAMFAIGLHALVLAGGGMLFRWGVTNASPAERQWAVEYVMATGAEPKSPDVQVVRAAAGNSVDIPMPQLPAPPTEQTDRVDAAKFLRVESRPVHPQVVLGPVSISKTAGMLALSAHSPDVIGTDAGFADLPVGLGVPGSAVVQAVGGPNEGAGGGTDSGVMGVSSTTAGISGITDVVAAGPVVFVPATPLAGNPDPVYPAWARRMGKEGTVTVQLSISADGRVTDAKVTRSSGETTLDEEAVRTALRMRFTPARRNGTAVACEAEKQYQFVR